MKNNLTILIVLIAILAGVGLITKQATSGVNLKNGNFYISYSDIDLPGPFDFEILRTYNSKSTEKSFFGTGWGSIFLTRLEISGDGSLVVREYGAGGKTRFQPMIDDPGRIDHAINKLTQAVITNGGLTSPKAIIDFKTEMRNNAEKLHANWVKYYKLGYVENPYFEVGSQWVSKQRGSQELIKTDSGYKRTGSNGVKELFDNHGNMIQYQTSSGVIYLDYDDENNLNRLYDNVGRSIDIETDENGMITKATGTDMDGDTQVAYYEFNDKQMMIKNIDAAGNIFRYSYDTYYNMTAISYEDGKEQLMEYYPETFFIKEITHTDGEKVRYEYVSYFDEAGNKDDDHYGTKVIKAGTWGDTITNFYDYEIRTKETGERYTYRITEDVEGVVTQTTYNECCGLPVIISRNGYVTTFAYNNKGLMTEKITESKIIKMDYHPELDKITYVSYYYPDDKKPYEWYSFAYNDMGNLTRAEDETSWVMLHYNDAQKITSMETEDQELVFTYNEIGKPIRIEIADVGAIDVTYDKWGEIESVNSEEGHSISLQVTQAFQDLLSLVKPAGVDLNM